MFEQLSNMPISWVSGAVGADDRNAAETRSDNHGVVQNDVLPSDWTVKFVSPPRRVHHKFYNVICNPLLWFLLHRSWIPTFTPNIGTQEHDVWERDYKTVFEEIRRAARKVNEAAKNSNLILIYEENNFYRAIVALSIYDTLVSVPLADGVGRSPLDGPIVNTKKRGMILSDNDATKGLFVDSVSTVGITDIDAISAAMEAELYESSKSRFTHSEAILDNVRSIRSRPLVNFSANLTKSTTPSNDPLFAVRSVYEQRSCFDVNC
jgi:trehalose-6-phosphate synthase